MKLGYKIVILFAIGTHLAWSQCGKPDLANNGIATERCSFFSASLGRTMPYEILLPAKYSATVQRYPVLFLLHGWEGDETNWFKYTRLIDHAAGYAMIIVMPRAENSWYVNSATRSADRFQDYILDDLIREIDSHFRTIADGHGRAIAGLSMGGYGALLLALKRPELFAVAASMSGAFAGPSGVENVMPYLRASTDAAFGNAGSSTRRDNNLDMLIAAADASRTPYLLLDCGASDPLLESDRHVAAELSAHHIAYEYHEYPGAHTWEFWNDSLPFVLNVTAKQLHVGGQASAATVAHTPVTH